MRGLQGSFSRLKVRLGSNKVKRGLIILSIYHARRKSGVPNYQNELLLNIVEGILPSGPEQWKIVALNYQQAAKEDFLRYYDDVRRHFIEMLCKKMQRQTGLNNKSGPTPEVARAQLIHRKILVNEAAVTAGGDNEAEGIKSDAIKLVYRVCDEI